MSGLSILHITDLHVRKGRPLPGSSRDVIAALRETPADLAFFTGDYMNHPGDEPAALLALRELVGACRTRLGVFGVFGNHDTWELRRRAREIPGVTWLADRGGIAEPADGLRLVGSDEPEDLLSTLAAAPSGSRTSSPAPLTLALVHYPTEICVAADLGLPLLFAGHTHAGQFRVSTRFAPHTSCDLPADLAGGVLRLRQTLCIVSRGLGGAVIDMRVNCPVQVPLIVLRRGPLPEIAPDEHGRITAHTPW